MPTALHFCKGNVIYKQKLTILTNIRFLHLLALINQQIIPNLILQNTTLKIHIGNKIVLSNEIDLNQFIQFTDRWRYFFFSRNTSLSGA